MLLDPSISPEGQGSLIRQRHGRVFAVSCSLLPPGMALAFKAGCGSEQLASLLPLQSQEVSAPGLQVLRAKCLHHLLHAKIDTAAIDHCPCRFRRPRTVWTSTGATWLSCSTRLTRRQHALQPWWLRITRCTVDASGPLPDSYSSLACIAVPMHSLEVAYNAGLVTHNEEVRGKCTRGLSLEPATACHALLYALRHQHAGCTAAPGQAMR